MSNFQIKGLKVLRRLNPFVNRRRRKKDKKSKQHQQDTSSLRLTENLVDRDIQSLLESFNRRCISQDFISEMKEAFFLFDKVSFISQVWYHKWYCFVQETFNESLMQHTAAFTR